MSLFISDESANTSIASEVDDNYTGTPSSTDTQAGKKADLAGPGIGDYADLEMILPGLSLAPDSQRNAKSDFPSAPLHRRRLVQGTRTTDGPGTAHRGCRERRQRHDRDGCRTPIPFHISNDRDRQSVDA